MAVRAARRKAARWSSGPRRSGSTDPTAPRSRRAARARTRAAGSRARSDRGRSPRAILSITLRLAVGRMRPGNADALAALDQDLGERERDDQRAVELGLLGKPRGEHHRGRAVGPDPHRMRGFPFLLAHIEMIVARGAAPVDPLRRLARHEAAILPEILPRAGAAAAVQPVDDGGGDATRLEDQPRHGGGERACRAGRTARRFELLVASWCGFGHQLIRRASSGGRSPRRWSRRRRAPRR